MQFTNRQFKLRTKYGAMSGIRLSHGYSLLELPMMMWVVFLVILMPMVALATMTLKATLMNAAVQDGVNVAAKAKTFQSGTADKPAATTLADGAIRNVASKFAGLSVQSITTDIVVTPVAGGAVTRSGKLTIPADTSRFIYQVETVAKAKIDPLLPLNPAMVGNIPGLSAPMFISYAARQMAENPQGLDK